MQKQKYDDSKIHRVPIEKKTFTTGKNNDNLCY